MNSVQLIGRLTRDPEVRYTGNQMAVATFSIAIDRPPKPDGTKETDFPRITVFGRQAENCEKYLVKGRLVGIEGRIQTGSYTNRNGDKVYTTDVVANRVEFLEWGDRQSSGGGYSQNRFGGGNDFGGQSQNNFGVSAVRVSRARADSPHRIQVTRYRQDSHRWTIATSRSKSISENKIFKERR